MSIMRHKFNARKVLKMIENNELSDTCSALVEACHVIIAMTESMAGHSKYLLQYIESVRNNPNIPIN